MMVGSCNDYNTINDSVNPYSIMNTTNLNISGNYPDVELDKK